MRKDWIPQLADTDALVKQLLASPLPPGLRLYGLVPNRIGLQRAVECGLRDVAVFMSAGETHNQKNTNKSIAASLAEFEPLIASARAQGVAVRAYLSCVWGCPYEGKVDPVRALEIASALRGFGASEISLGDTIGVGNPKQTAQIVSLFLAGRGASAIPVDQLALHMHDTHGTALANCLAGYDLGVRIFDASIGGTGGYPYAPGAAGNVATEDLASVFADMGVETGITLEKLFDAGEMHSSASATSSPGGACRPRSAGAARCGWRSARRRSPPSARAVSGGKIDRYR